MAQLDKFLGLLGQPGVRELRLATGEPPSFVTEDGPQPAASARPTAEQVLALLAEVIDPVTIEAARRTGTAAASLQRPHCPPIGVIVSFAGQIIEANFTLRAAHAPAAADASRSAPAVTPAAVAAGAPGAPRPAPVAAAPTAPGPAAGHRIDALFREMCERGASDLHLSSGERPVLRVDGDIVRLEHHDVLTPEALWELIRPIVTPRALEEYETTHDADFAYPIEGLARFRCNVFADRKGPGAVFRQIPSTILTAEQLGLSPAILELCALQKGLVLVTGPTGSGKSTTLTAMIDHVNTTRRDHVITIEDPIEFVHENRSCLINQREVGAHTDSFKRALRAALREDPDIVLVGELRDLETMAIAIETAETGHLVFGTLHTTTAVSTVDRIIDQFPSDQQAQVRTMLSESLKGVISQILCKKIGGGRVAAMEVLIGTPSVANLVREAKTFQIPSIMQTGRKLGMVTLSEALASLVRRNLITQDEAMLRAVDKVGLASALKAAGVAVPA